MAGDWVHSRCVRRLSGMATNSRAVRIELSVRRLYCGNPACPKVTSAGQADGLTVRCPRRIPLLQALVEMAGILPAGRGGARLPGLPNAPLSRTGVLLKLMKVPLPAIAAPRVPDVDFALYAEVYGTLPVGGSTRLLGDAENADGSGTGGADHREQDRPTGVVPVGRLPARCRGRRQGAEAGMSPPVVCIV
ncbi:MULTISPECIES: hypothetical protein [unclassified Streptomyces]|uniref:hypothetical protein n=1 Tax=unclassified Streptomyces TaxID=2593676 RepID=UPI002E80509C|nr:hypothetical protein [Streptomyces sp. NBC_00589]WTI42247.1 hypothetical protein OIC96_48700 [Streptomyces sp. NBC_00775]WUB24071.1 hypothetical protein OHA51_01020 [Streptomyces sp. NBC_00589]